MSNATSLHSNAFNFMSYLQGGVDPRTGQYTVSLSLLDNAVNALQGPDLPLALFFNPLNTLDSGYGLGWNLQLSQYDTQRQVVSVHTGATFKYVGKAGARMLLPEQKIDDFRLFDDGGGYYRIAHRSGLVERLQVQSGTSLALPVEVYGEKGHVLKLAYAQFRDAQNDLHYRLQSITDHQGQRVFTLERKNAANGREQIDIQLNPDRNGTAQATYQLLINRIKQVDEVVLPTADKASWRYAYKEIKTPVGNGPQTDTFYCIDDVHTPTGAHETVEYSTGVSDKEHHQVPGNPVRRVPRVLTHSVDPGSGPGAVMKAQYSYALSADATGYRAGHNFLGNNLTHERKDDLDYLFGTRERYTYGSIETRSKDGEKHEVERRFNRFHLLEEERNTHTDTQTRVTSTDTTVTQYYSRGGYFEADYAYCQLPGTTTRTWKRNVGQPYSEAVVREYYENATLKSELQATGIKVINTWYPTEGAGTDQKDPNYFTPRLESTTTVPDSAAQQPGAPTLYRHYRYEVATALAGAGPKTWHRVTHDTLHLDNAQGAELQVTQYGYFDTPAQFQTHGRLETETVTLNGKATITSYCYDCEEKSGKRVTAPVEFPAHIKALYGRITPLRRKLLVNEPVLTTFQTVTGWDHKEGGSPEESRQKSMTLTRSLLTGEPVLNADDNDVQIHYEYDELRRVKAETVAPDDDAYKATRNYSYTLCSKPGEQAQQTRVDVNEVTTRTTLDGLNRVVMEERQDKDFDAGNFRLLYTAVYNTLGQLTEQTEYDWHEKTLVPLKSTFEYDIWGQQRAVTGPDNVKLVEETDPVGTAESKGRRVLTWREEGTGANPKKTGVTETWFNRFDEPARIERRDLGNRRLSLQVNGHDGLGRLVEQVVGDTVKRTTKFAYDHFNRNLDTTLPDGALVTRKYAEHSSEDLPISIAVQESAVVKEKELGTQGFDGLGRMAVSITGGREQTYVYDAGVRKAKTMTTPEGEIHFTYELKLSENPVSRVLGATAGGLAVVYDYDKKNARLNGWTMPPESERPWQKLERKYYQTGQIKSETWTQHASGDEGAPPIGESQAQHYVYSHRGRLLSYTDVLGQIQTNVYYPTGQLQKTTLKDKTGKVLLETDFTYYELGQLKSHTTHDREAGQSLATELTYDEFDRETERKFTAGSMVQTLVQTYDDVDAMKKRTLSEGGVNLRVEDYEYDKRQRLEKYTFTGRNIDNDPYQPQDPYGNYITGQQFTFDALDNITRVVTAFVGGSNTATYHFENKDPAQLSRITNKATDSTTRTLNGYPEEIVLEYDGNGNLVVDEQGRALKYNALNQLLSVSEGGKEIASYLYNPQNILMAADEEQRFYLGDELTALKTRDGGTRISTSPAGPLAEITLSQEQER